MKGRKGAKAAQGAAPAKSTAPLLKEIEKAMNSVKLYPVAASRDSKDAALESLKKAYARGGESVRQHVLFQVHEALAQSQDLRVMKGVDYFRQKNPKQAPGQLRMSVYREMFDYTTSVEGLVELVLFLGELKGDEPAKLLSHLFSSFSASESEVNRMLRNAAIEALGESDSSYALGALLEYSRLSDSDKMFGRLVGSLTEWADKVDKLDVPEDEKKDLKDELKDLMSKEEKATQYG